MTRPALLSDAQVRSFIANGFLRLTPNVAPSLHAEIDGMLREAVENEAWYGNNILARVPQMHEVLACSAVHGAIASLAGPDYYLHPHRAVHTSTPVAEGAEPPPTDANAPAMGKGSRAGSGWHQDAQSPLSRARHHTPRFLIGFYFPHDTPVAMGPTRIQGGSHLNAELVPPHGVLLEPVPAGTFYLLHFDMVHAGFPNHTERTRYMVKFVFARTRPQAGPTWHNLEPNWQRPADCIPDFDLPATWGYLWHWLRGVPVEGNGVDAKVTGRHVAHFDSADQAERLEAIHRAAGGDVERLTAALLTHAGKNRHQRELAKDARGKPLPRDAAHSRRGWSERAVVMEDAAYALAAAGDRALPALTKLLAHSDPWMQINAAFALGELGAPAKGAVPALARLLESPHQTVVRQALDGISAIGTGFAAALPSVERLLRESNPDWQEPQVGRGWTGEDQVRMNAAELLLAAATAGEALPAVERLAAAALGDRNGYVSAIATEALQRIGTPTAMAAALRFLACRRWDDTLRRSKPF